MEKKLSALIVDDEENALTLLNKLLEDTNQFSEVRCASSAAHATQELNQFVPDLIFLDIKMPEMDGFTFLDKLKKEKRTTEVVFVTAYDQFALKALKNHAFDYLLKPVDRKELLDCIMQFKDRKQEPNLLDRLEKLMHEQKDNNSNKLHISTRTGYLFIDPASILYCQADGNYTLIDMGERQHLCSMQLGVVENLLPKNAFVRLGRSLIINFNFVSSIDRKNHKITFEKEGKPYAITISKAQLKELEEKQGL
jgi:two-component system, LytTR family, response regulator